LIPKREKVSPVIDCKGGRGRGKGHVDGSSRTLGSIQLLRGGSTPTPINGPLGWVG